MTFTKVLKKLTPTGLWDNGLYEVTGEEVSFPVSVMRRAVWETYECPGVKEACLRITVDCNSWLVLAEKGKFPSSLRRRL